MNMIFDFSGRIGRLQYWLTMFGVMVFYSVIFMALGIALSIDPNASSQPSLSMPVLLVICGTYIIGFWANIAAMVRRYHDRNKSGWWFFICLVPFIGIIWQFIELGFLSGTPGGNAYGVLGQSGGSWSDDDDYESGINGNLDDLIQQRLVERQQQDDAAVQSNEPLVGRRNQVGNDRPVFGRRT